MSSVLKNDPFEDIQSVIDGKFNSEHPYISRVLANVNLELGPSHYNYKDWNPSFGDISRYTLCKWIGSGRYSDVFLSLQDGHKSCAIKLLKPVNTDRVRRELKILSEVQGQKNILELWDIVIDDHEGIPAMITEAVPNEDWKTLFDKFSLNDIRFYVYRVLQALAHVHSRGVMHRDVKPLNILCKNPKECVKLADWGLAEFYHPMRKYSIHVATRYYKAPELLLGFMLYDYSVDIWSTGVLLLEALSLKVHIFDADDNNRMIDAVAAVMGCQDILNWGTKYNIKIGQRKIDRISKYNKKRFEDIIPNSREKFRDPEALDLVSKMLVIDHKERISAAEALQHPFFEKVRQYDAEHAV
ncbi:CMGC family protein kinase [Tritrichomonas foetus]|uniref:non-specific serine/threonine protein kinase n=1 Tax=Tritrichomonas foetus TaxID=1144522 RepID=A0A1J4L202_9EUKA|nr:CMGC family protein kinase [Tritrichomonas foetus]|eukprot:OHT15917.1 CMGC family protein kinase [Tritrichomonas foetus]